MIAVSLLFRKFVRNNNSYCMEERGCGKYDYVAELGWHFESVVFDDDGIPSLVPHHTCFLDDRSAKRVLQQLELTDREEEFYKQDSIIPVIEAYGLDKEKFWYAVVYVSQLTRLWAKKKGIKPLPTALEQLTTMRDEIKDRHEFRVIIDNPQESHSFVMAGNRLIRELLVPSLDKLIKEECVSDYATHHERPLWRVGESYKKTEMTWYAANMFKLLFELLELPVIRSRIGKSDKYAVVSYDKSQLIAELILFLGLTDNSNLDGNSIRAILRSERTFDIGPL